MTKRPAYAQTFNWMDTVFGGLIAVSLGIGGWLFKWSRSTDQELTDHRARIGSIERTYAECSAARKHAEQELWNRFNERMDAMTAQLSQIAQSIGQLQGALDRPRK